MALRLISRPADFLFLQPPGLCFVRTFQRNLQIVHQNKSCGQFNQLIHFVRQPHSGNIRGLSIISNPSTFQRPMEDLVHHTTPNEELGPMYQPSGLDRDDSATFRLLRTINRKYATSLSSYAALYEWSTSQIDQFWSTIWDETTVIGEKGCHVLQNDPSMSLSDNPPWFSQAKVNWAENMLWSRSPDQVALIQASTSVRLCSKDYSYRHQPSICRIAPPSLHQFAGFRIRSCTR
jgi:hypothetical protein